MAAPKLSKLELRVMDALWTLGPTSVREILEHFPDDDRPAYTTVQTILYRLEEKKAVQRTKKIGNVHIFEPLYTQKAVHKRVIDDLLGVFGGRAQPLVSHLIESGQLTLDDIDEARQTLRKLKDKE
ncbi:MAG: BlaI/MecI/CopY family transcriptional regulator [Gammaproteobacteria bacterium]|nr:BlaI/MecI/CopY family transcriptional regulator [Gammaproteobacteria bacterium]